MFSKILFLACSFCMLFSSIQELKAQNYVQVPAVGGVISSSSNINFFYGPGANLNGRAAMLYPPSELINFPISFPINSIGLKLAGPTTGDCAGDFDIYLIPTTDTVYNLPSNWNSLMQTPGLKQVYNGSLYVFSPAPRTGYLNFTLDSTFSLPPGKGFYLAYEFYGGIKLVMQASYECNISLSNSFHAGKSNADMPQVAPPTLTLSSNYRHVLRLGYNGPTGLSEKNYNNTIKVYPNPTREILVVDLSHLKNVAVQVTLQDLTGKVVKTESVKNEENQLRLTDIPPGIYSLHLTSGNENVVKRVVIE